MYLDSTWFLVSSIIILPKAVVDWDISKQGSFPTWAPVKPYTELALIFRGFWQEILFDRALDEHVATRCLNILVRGQAQPLQRSVLQDQGGVSEVVGHHDAGVQEAQIQCGNGYIIVSLNRVNNSGTLIVLIRCLVGWWVGSTRFCSVAFLDLVMAFTMKLDGSVLFSPRKTGADLTGRGETGLAGEGEGAAAGVAVCAGIGTGVLEDTWDRISSYQHPPLLARPRDIQQTDLTLHGNPTHSWGGKHFHISHFRSLSFFLSWRSNRFGFSP